MFNLYINYLKDQQINKNLIAFADEIVIYCKQRKNNPNNTKHRKVVHGKRHSSKQNKKCNPLNQTLTWEHSNEYKQDIMR